MSLSWEGLEEMAAANVQRRNQALGKAFANVVSEVLANLIPSIWMESFIRCMSAKP